MTQVRTSELIEFGVEVLGGRMLVELGYGSRLEKYSSLKFASFEGTVELGSWSYIVSGFLGHASVGRYCSIGEDVQIGRQSHPINLVSTSPTFYVDLRNVSNTAQIPEIEIPKHTGPGMHHARRTVIGHDVYIGHGAIILPGVTIHNGAVIGAGSVVTKDVDAYSITAGNPATHRRFRFDEDMREMLLRSNWWERMPWEMDLARADNPSHFIESLTESNEPASWFLVGP